MRQRWRDRFRYLMVDEFQDTNKLQLELVTLLADERRNVAVVGDDDQSIYGWRGAEVSNILEFEHHFPNPKVVKLEQNYRSTNSILGTANSLIKHNPRRRAKRLWSASGDGEKVRLVEAPNDREEGQFIAEEIQRRHLDTRRGLGKFRGPLPDERAVAHPRGEPAPFADPVSHRWRQKLLRSARGEGPDRLHERARESRRRREPAPHHQHARARHQRRDR